VVPSAGSVRAGLQADRVELVPAGDLGRVAKTDVSAASEPTRVTTDNAHVGAATEPSCVVTTDAHVGATSKLDAAVLRAQTKDALVGLGWKPAIAYAAVAAALTAIGPEMTLEQLIFEALRQCPGSKRDGRTSSRAP